MHPYKSIHVLAVDAGRGQPFLDISLTTGGRDKTFCTAEKRFPFTDVGEVRSILGWASQAFLAAADELHEDGWTIRHSITCPEGENHGLTA